MGANITLPRADSESTVGGNIKMQKNHHEMEKRKDKLSKWDVGEGKMQGAVNTNRSRFRGQTRGKRQYPFYQIQICT
jgi:hypothetical protein